MMEASVLFELRFWGSLVYGRPGLPVWLPMPQAGISLPLKITPLTAFAVKFFALGAPRAVFHEFPLDAKKREL